MFNERLKELRKERSVTQQSLANSAQISRSIISEYESGLVEPTLTMLKKLADFFNVSTDYLLGRTDELGGVIAPSPIVYSSDEQELLNCYRSLSEKYKDVALVTMRGLAGNNQSSARENINAKKKGENYD